MEGGRVRWAQSGESHVTLTATYTPSAPLVNGMTYTVIVSNAADLAGNVMDHVDWMFVTVPLGTGPFTVFKSTDKPVVATDDDPQSSEVGVKIRSDVRPIRHLF